MSTVPVANTSATAARKRGVFRLQLANLSGELVDALTDRRESERRCFQSVGRVASGHSCWCDPASCGDQPAIVFLAASP